MRQGTQPDLLNSADNGNYSFRNRWLSINRFSHRRNVRGRMMGGGMCSPIRFEAWTRENGMSWEKTEDFSEDLDELSDRVDDLEKRVNEMPVFVQDLVKQTVERMKK